MLTLLIHKAAKAGLFTEEIIPIELRGETISVDDTIRMGVTSESLQKLKPVFPDWGEAFTTAGNASGVGDGAAICILTTRERAQREGMEVLGKFVASTFVGRYLSDPPAALFDVGSRCRAATHGHCTRLCDSKSVGTNRSQQGRYRCFRGAQSRRNVCLKVACSLQSRR